MRVTDAALYFRYLNDFRALREAEDRAVQQLADGKRVRLASDDPTGARVAMEHRVRLARLEGYDRAAGMGRYELETVESVLGDVFDLLTEAHTKALAAGSPGSDPEILANQVDELRNQLLDLANTSRAGRHLFGGTQTLRQPFDTNGVYSGNGSEVQVPVDDGQTVGSTLSGERVFHDGGNVFEMLSDLATALRDEDSAAINTLIPAIDAARDHVNAVRADVGGRLERIDHTLDLHSDEKLGLQKRISEIEDADPVETALELAAIGSSYEALAASASQVLGRSLFDYLG